MAFARIRSSRFRSFRSREPLSHLRLAGTGVAAAICVPLPALAHGEIANVGAFYNGILHPFLSPAHLVTLLALGLLIGQRGPQQDLLAVVTLAVGLLAGLLLSPFGGAAASDPVLLAIATVVGLAVAAARPPPLVLLAGLAAVAGFVIGLESRIDGLVGLQRAGAMFGTLLAATLCAACLAGIVQQTQRHWQQIGVRVMGAWLTAAATLVLAFTLTQMR